MTGPVVYAHELDFATDLSEEDRKHVVFDVLAKRSGFDKVQGVLQLRATHVGRFSAEATFRLGVFDAHARRSALLASMVGDALRLLSHDRDGDFAYQETRDVLCGLAERLAPGRLTELVTEVRAVTVPACPQPVNQPLELDLSEVDDV